MRLPPPTFDEKLAAFGLLLLALALPWEILQRLPWGMTLTKAATLSVLLAAAWRVAVRRQLPWRTGLEWPLLILFAVWTLRLLPQGWTAPLQVLELRLYLGYAFFIYAALPYLHNPERNLRILQTFAASAALVGILSLACAAGWLWPGSWRPLHFPWHGSLLEVYASGAPMRMAPVSPYVNEGALRFLAAAGVLLGGFSACVSKGRCVVCGLLLFLTAAGLAVTQSRTGLLFLALFTAAAAWPWAAARLGRKRGTLLLIVAGLVVVVGVGYVLREYLLRADSSVESRMAAYKAALALLPKNLWLGTGLGGSDAAIAASPFAQTTGGQTIHSVPLKLLLETGLAGTAALALFFAAAARRIGQGLTRNHLPAAKPFRSALIAAVAAVLLMGAAHPFETHPLYPFLGALALGPVAVVPSRRGLPQEAPPWPRWGCPIAAALLIFIASINGVAHQRLTGQLAQASRALGHAAQNEWDGRYTEAEALYAAALDALPHPHKGACLRNARFYGESARLVDLPRQLEAMRLLNTKVGADAAALFGLGRCALSHGEDATQQLAAAWSKDAALCEAVFVLREALWQRGHYEKAHAWLSAEMAQRSLPENAAYRTYLGRLEARLTEIEGNRPETWVERARLLRMLGHYGALRELLLETRALGGQPKIAAAEATGQIEALAGTSTSSEAHGPASFP